MICILLCAGYATRMYPLTKNFPKPLLEIKGKTIIDYLIDDLNKKNYIEKYIVVSNHKFYNYFCQWKNARKENIFVLDDLSTSNSNRLGAVRDIEFAIKCLNIKDDILVLAGDNLLNFSLNNFIEFSNKTYCNTVMFYIENDLKKLQRTGVVVLNDEYKIIDFVEKPFKPKTNFAVPPFYIFKKEFLYLIAKGIENGCQVDAPGMFLEWFYKKAPIKAWKMNGHRIDIGNLDDYYKIVGKI